MNKKSNCIICKKKLSGKQAKYCSSACKNKALQSYPAQKKRGIERKWEDVALYADTRKIFLLYLSITNPIKKVQT